MTVRPEQPDTQPAPPAPRAKGAPAAHCAPHADLHGITHLTETARQLGPLLIAILVVSGFAEMAYGIVNFSAMPVYIKAIGLGEQWIGLVATAYLLAEGLLKSPFGMLGDRVGRKKLLIIGPFVSCFTALLTPFIHNPFLLLLLRVLDGMGLAALWPSAFSLIGDHVPPNKRATAMSFFNVAYMIGIAFGPAIGGAANDAAQHLIGLPPVVAKQASFYLSALLFAMTVLVTWKMIPDLPPAHHERDAHGEETGFRLSDIRAMLERMPILLGLAFLTFLGVGLVMAYAKVFVMETFHLSEGAYGALLIGPALVIALSSIPLGTLTDRLGNPMAMKVGYGLATVGFWLLLAFPTKVTLVLLGSVVGFGFVIGFPALMAHVSATCNPKQRGAALGAIGTAQGLGAILGVASSGFLYRYPAFSIGVFGVPEHGLPFLGCAIMIFCAFLLALFGFRSAPQHTPRSSP